MKKKLLALLLAAMMILSVLPAVASAETTTIGTEDNTIGFWGAFSDYYTIEANSYQTFTFKNYTSKAEVWDNYIVVLSTVAKRGESGYKEYVLMRADNWGWGDSYSTATNIINGDVNTAEYDGANVTVTIVNRNGKADIYSVVTNGDYKNFRHCGNITTDNGAIQAFFSVEAGHLEQMTSGSQVTMADGPILGALDNYTYGRLAASDTWSVNPGYEKTIRFHNYSDKVAAWNNCLIGLNTKNGVWYARIDNFVEDADATYLENDVNKEIDASNAGFEAYNWEALKAHMDNAEVTATVKNDGEAATVTISAYNESTEKTFVQIYKNVPLDDNSNISFFLTNGAGNHVVLNEVKENVKIAPFVQASLTLGDQVGMNLIFSGKLDGLTAVIDGEDVAINPVNGEFKYTKEYAAKEIAQKLSLSLKDASNNNVAFYSGENCYNESNPFSKSVEDICIKYQSSDVPEADKVAAEALRTYGYFAYKYFEKNKPALVEYIICPNTNLVDDTKDDEIKSELASEFSQTLNDDIKVKSIFLTLESKTELNVLMEPAMDGYTYKWGNEIVASNNGLLTFKGITARNLVNPVIVSIQDGETPVGDFVCCPLYYVKLALENMSDDAELCDVVRALYFYAKAANSR